MNRLDSSRLEVMKHAFTAIPEIMGNSLKRSAFSPNIKERMDESCAIFTGHGKLLAQAEHIPVHLGAMPCALESVLDEVEMLPEDQVVLNDPYAGGTHLPDITLIKPVYHREECIGYVVNRAHHADVGGTTPGSMPGNSRRLEEEGIVIPPIHLMRDGKIVHEVLRIFERMRSPEERKGDIRAQLGANQRGSIEFLRTVQRFGEEDYRAFTHEIMNYSERRTRESLRTIPDGKYLGDSFMEWKRAVKLRVKIEIKHGEVKMDFSGSSSQVDGNINAPLPVTLSAVYYVIRCIIPEDIHINAGTFRPVEVKIPGGCILNPRYPAAVSAGNVETSQRVVELLFGALREELLERIPAEGQGTMNNLIIGNDKFTYYETIGGGAGASYLGNGESGVHVHMTNTKNTPVEVLENEYPLRVISYHLRKGSGGEGLHRGGDGIVREIQVLEDCELSIQSQMRREGPKGSHGGGDGAPGRNIIVKDDGEKKLDSMVNMPMKKGWRIRIETPGGGGWGRVEGVE